ncbi:MAG TPA: lipid-A-disaccharide synthase [Bryobacteraceae bacterium]|jgi:lipid-A-disaccharide synthase|nr:lipid-A-disaccharide synthase [Bryobacteraceae bacterium]
MRVFLSAGEASGDLYAASLVTALRARVPADGNQNLEFFGCAGPRMQAAGVRPIIDLRSIAVVGLVEVIGHIPRIYRLFRKLIRAIPEERPDIAVLIDAPDFNLRVAKKLRGLGVPVVYLIAPQAWAWREGRVRILRRTVKRLLCIFPFESSFFEEHGVPTTYIGHPLARLVKRTQTRAAFCAKFNLPEDRPIVTLLPGSRHGEIARHMPDLLDAVQRIRERHPSTTFILALPPGFSTELNNDTSRFSERIRASSIQIIEGGTWDALAYSEVALAASGTVTIEAALLGAPMVTFYKVNALSWMLGRWLVKAPFLSMVNLVAGRKVAPELIQGDMTGERIAREAIRLLENADERQQMREDLAEVARKLASDHDPMEAAAEWIERIASSDKTVFAG